MDILSVYEEVFGVTPRGFNLLEKSLEERDVDRLLGAWQDLGEHAEPISATGQGIYPLVSHHAFQPHGLFGDNRSQSISEKTLRILLAHDGLVAADPIHEVFNAVRTDGLGRGRAMFARLTQQLADVEQLITAGQVRFVSDRPALSDPRRLEILQAFGVGDDLAVFIRFAEAGAAAAADGGSLAKAYILESIQLFESFGVREHHPLAIRGTKVSAAEAVDISEAAVQQLGRALLHVSWQIPIANSNSGVDIALGSALERDLFARLLEDSALVTAEAADGEAETRHFRRAAMGDIPNLETLHLSISDALAIRSDDMFAGFRDSMHEALTKMESELIVNPRALDARKVFEKQMSQASRDLAGHARKAPFREWVKAETVPLSIGVVISVIGLSQEDINQVLLGGGYSFVHSIWGWMKGRQMDEGQKVAIRYATTLGARDKQSI